MLELLGAAFVQRPDVIVSVAGAFAIAHAVLRTAPVGRSRKPSALLVPTAAWGIYAAWEFWVGLRSPEANIRVDLLLIWPLLLVISVVYTRKALRRSAS